MCKVLFLFFLFFLFLSFSLFPFIYKDFIILNFFYFFQKTHFLNFCFFCFFNFFFIFKVFLQCKSPPSFTLYLSNKKHFFTEKKRVYKLFFIYPNVHLIVDMVFQSYFYQMLFLHFLIN